MPRSGRKAIHSTSTVTISGFLNDFMLHEASYSAHNSCFLNVAKYYFGFSEVWESKKSAVTSANAILTYLLKQFPLYHRDLEMLAEFSLFSNDFSTTILTHALQGEDNRCITAKLQSEQIHRLFKISGEYAEKFLLSSHTGCVWAHLCLQTIPRFTSQFKELLPGRHPVGRPFVQE